MQGVILQSKAALACDLDLPFLDLRVVELFDVSALDAYDVVVVPALFQLEHRFAAFEVVPDEKARLLELGEHAVDGRKTRVGAFLHEHLVNVFGRQVTHTAFLEKLEYSQPRHRGFEAYRFKVSGRAQGGFLPEG
jgi:hypothetical protein